MGSLGEDPFSAMTQMAQRNMQMWSDLQKSFFSAAGIKPHSKDDN